MFSLRLGRSSPIGGRGTHPAFYPVRKRQQTPKRRLDRAKIASKQREIVTLQARMQEKGLAARTAVAEILTPGQRAQLPAYGPGSGGGRGRGMGFGNRW